MQADVVARVQQTRKAKTAASLMATRGVLLCGMALSRQRGGEKSNKWRAAAKSPGIRSPSAVNEEVAAHLAALCACDGCGPGGDVSLLSAQKRRAGSASQEGFHIIVTRRRRGHLREHACHGSLFWRRHEAVGCAGDLINLDAAVLYIDIRAACDSWRPCAEAASGKWLQPSSAEGTYGGRGHEAFLVRPPMSRCGGLQPAAVSNAPAAGNNPNKRCCALGRRERHIEGVYVRDCLKQMRNVMRPFAPRRNRGSGLATVERRRHLLASTS